MPEQLIFSNRFKEIRFILMLLVALSLLLVASYALGSKVEKEENFVPERANLSFPEVALQAKAAYVYDARTKSVLFAKNENTRMPLASLTKLMSALVAEELSPGYGTVTIGREALSAEGDTGLLSGERWALKDLLDFSLVSSSNDGIRAVALAFGALGRSDASAPEILNDFVIKMNQKASELNLQNTYYWNETGLDESELKGGAYGTAKDMAAIFEHVLSYHPAMLEATRQSSISLASLDNRKHTAKNTNILAESIPGFIGSKTGFTATAGGNLVFAFDPELGRPIIISILGSTEAGRFEDAEKLITATLEHINK